jgi:hypothetical protein
VKSHHHSTAWDVAALGPHGLESLPVQVFGGIALNGPVGGINPRAVDVALRMGARIVWMPTIAARTHIEFHERNYDAFPVSTLPLLPEVPVEVLTEEGDLRDETAEVIRLIAAGDAILASGHLSPSEIIAVFEGAAAVGCRRLLLNHPNFIVDVGSKDVEHIVSLGAYVEHNLSLYDDESIFHRWDVEVLAESITAVGPEHTIIASDLGQQRNPLPLDSYTKICSALKDCGIGDHVIRQIVVENPARLLGIAP